MPRAVGPLSVKSTQAAVQRTLTSAHSYATKSKVKQCCSGMLFDFTKGAEMAIFHFFWQAVLF